MAAGQRPINNVVDITNYVMLLTGQPMHAFDLDQVAGAQLTVRRAEPNEQVQTLDGQTRTLDEDMVLIADADGPTSIAGVMGGARSEVSPATTRVLMEAANWNGANIHRTSLKLGLRSEASGRFEKGLQPEQAMWGQAVAAGLMVDLAGAVLSPGTIDVGGPGPEPRSIRLRDARVAGLLGAPIPRERCAGDPPRAGVRNRAGTGRARGQRAGVPPRRCDPRGRSDRGGSAARRAREAARHAALAPQRVRASHPAPARSPRRRRRADRPGPVRDRGLELHRPRAVRPPADREPRGRAPEPALGRSGAAAHDAARVPARRGPAQPLARGGRGPAVRGRVGVSARREQAPA